MLESVKIAKDIMTISWAAPSDMFARSKEKRLQWDMVGSETLVLDRSVGTCWLVEDMS